MRSSQYWWQKLRTLVSNQVMVRGLVLIDFYLVLLLLMDIGAEMAAIDSDDGGPVINLYKITRQFRQSSKLWKIKTLQKMILKGRRGGVGGRGGRGADYIGYTLYFIHPRCHLVLIDGKGDSYSVSAGRQAGCVNLRASNDGSRRFHDKKKHY